MSQLPAHLFCFSYIQMCITALSPQMEYATSTLGKNLKHTGSFRSVLVSLRALDNREAAGQAAELLTRRSPPSGIF